jgi:hypothetical protein
VLIWVWVRGGQADGYLLLLPASRGGDWRGERFVLDETALRGGHGPSMLASANGRGLGPAERLPRKTLLLLSGAPYQLRPTVDRVLRARPYLTAAATPRGM